MATVRVTIEQVEAAKIEVDALRSADLTPDPMVVRLAEATDTQVEPGVAARRA